MMINRAGLFAMTHRVVIPNEVRDLTNTVGALNEICVTIVQSGGPSLRSG